MKSKSKPKKKEIVTAKQVDLKRTKRDWDKVLEQARKNKDDDESDNV